MSVFGGPDDNGVGPHEGLALVDPGDLKLWWFRRCFQEYQPSGTTGLARRLNVNAFYVACRWDYGQTPRAILRYSLCKVSANGVARFAQPVDFGPGNGDIIDAKRTKNTGLVADLSPALAAALNLKTDDFVTVELITATL